MRNKKKKKNYNHVSLTPPFSDLTSFPNLLLPPTPGRARGWGIGVVFSSYYFISADSSSSCSSPTLVWLLQSLFPFLYPDLGICRAVFLTFSYISLPAAVKHFLLFKKCVISEALLMFLVGSALSSSGSAL